MKKLYKIFSIAALAPALFVSCQQELVYEKGQEEDKDCFGVYFPSQDIPSEFDPTDPCEITVKVNRDNSEGDITVPVKVSQSEGDVFVLEDIKFEDGQSESSFKITFEKAELGVEYSLGITIEDTKYAKVYGTKPTYINCSLARVKWDPVPVIEGREGTEGVALWRDDFVTTFFGVQNVEYEVDVQVNAGKPGLYRFKNVYGSEYPYNKPGQYDDSRDYWLVINAEDPNAVYIEKQITGTDWGYGNWIVWSMADNYLKKGKSKAEVADLGVFGSLKDGVIKFPKGTLLFGMANYNSGGCYESNGSGMFRVTLPGGKDVDYTMSLSAELCAGGKVPVSFELGDDIAKVSYKVFEGKLDKEGIQTAHYEVVEDSEAPSVSESGTVDIQCPESGFYTLVAVGYDAEGVKRGYDGVSFGYVLTGDEEEKATVISAGLELTSRYEPEGYTKINSALFYVYGKDIQEVRMALLKSSDEALDDLEALVADLEPEDDDVLEDVNGSGYSDLFTGLDALTEYTFVVWASNGYTSKIVTSEIKTEGLELQKIGSGTFTYTLMFGTESEPSDDEGLELYWDPNYANSYLIAHWGNDVNFRFTYDPATGVTEVGDNYIGVDHPTYGPVYAVEYNNYAENPGPDSSFDSENNTFNFALIYMVSAGFLKAGIEKYVLDAPVDFTQYATETPAESAAATKAVYAREGSHAGLKVAVPVKEAEFASSFRAKEVGSRTDIRKQLNGSAFFAE